MRYIIKPRIIISIDVPIVAFNLPEIPQQFHLRVICSEITQVQFQDKTIINQILYLISNRILDY